MIVARALRERGHEVVFAVRDARAVSPMLDREGFRCLQAPSLPVSSGSDLPQIPASYPEMLLHYGFSDANALRTQILAWRALFAGVNPDVLVMNYAPTALLSSRGVGLPRVLLGTGFASPPRVSPMPSIRPWQDVPPRRLATNEQRALDAANVALESLGEEPLRAFYELLDVDEDILATLPELDHYLTRNEVQYWGPLYDGGGEVPIWPGREHTKVFVYLRPLSPAFKPLYDVLRSASVGVLWFGPGLTDRLVAELSTNSIRFSTRPVDISKVAKSADMAVIHGGHGTTAAMLLGGVPMLLVPENIEQLLLAKRISSLRIGKIIWPWDIRESLLQIVHDFSSSQHYRVQACRLREKYRALGQGNGEYGITKRIEVLMQIQESTHSQRALKPVVQMANE